MTSIDFLQATAWAGAATAVATQILKNPAIPVPATKYPRVTAAVIALISAGFVVYTQHTGTLPQSLSEWGAVAISSLIVSAIAYENILKVETTKDVSAQTDTVPPVGL